jgi:hypothetical protein
MIASFRIEAEIEGTGMHETRHWPSSIKFGGYDEEDGALTWTRTISNTSWDIKMESWTFGDNHGVADKSYAARLDPGVPYIYLSKAKYKIFAETMNTVYPEKPC